MNEKLFWAINRYSGSSPFLDKLMILISNRIRYVFLFVLIYLWVRDSSLRKLSKKAVLSIIGSFILNGILKRCFYKTRTYEKRKVGILIPSKKDSSFPSKHTLLTFAMSTSIFLYARVLGTILLGLSALTGFSRIWVGHHDPSDITKSAFIGSMFSVLFDKICLFSNKIKL
ncbi:undecaprenyl-diphosphatase [Bacillus pakistanensis]|uniref:Undecaprenyl-diphosphatase n=1 Tax=Rossellomorea pakistanensis TaxID=992288 RepID=A0ABS2NJ85_9BACI|nr:phosphatase PAP2 family protein [Bacillus pakistanensis]MBM7587860.1 undecaprenyl-diphosphatase [Bacillus pakistanensis]